MITTLWNQGIKKLGWCSLKDGIKGGKASPPQSILQEIFFDNGNLKKMFFKNFNVKLRKLYQQKKKGVCIQVYMHIDHNKGMLKYINTTNIENTYLV